MWCLQASALLFPLSIAFFASTVQHDALSTGHTIPPSFGGPSHKTGSNKFRELQAGCAAQITTVYPRDLAVAFEWSEQMT